MCKEFRPIAIGVALVAMVSASLGGPSHAVSPPADATDAAASTPCTVACATLKALGCPEGAQTDCVQVLAHIDGARAILTPSGATLTCAAIAAAQTVSAVEALGVGCRD